jgi:hypothetical protein
MSITLDFVWFLRNEKIVTDQLKKNGQTYKKKVSSFVFIFSMSFSRDLRAIFVSYKLNCSITLRGGIETFLKIIIKSLSGKIHMRISVNHVGSSSRNVNCSHIYIWYLKGGKILILFHFRLYKMKQRISIHSCTHYRRKKIILY